MRVSAASGTANWTMGIASRARGARFPLKKDAMRRSMDVAVRGIGRTCLAGKLRLCSIGHDKLLDRIETGRDAGESPRSNVEACQ